MNIYGTGLTGVEVEALTALFEARGSVPIEDRSELEIPEEFLYRTDNKYLFAFWLQLGLIKQDRPMLFWIGTTFFIYAIVSGIVQIIFKIYQFAT